MLQILYARMARVRIQLTLPDQVEKLIDQFKPPLTTPVNHEIHLL